MYRPLKIFGQDGGDRSMPSRSGFADIPIHRIMVRPYGDLWNPTIAG